MQLFMRGFAGLKAGVTAAATKMPVIVYHKFLMNKKIRP
jgi:hypothetical protein